MSASIQSRRRTGRRYVVTLALAAVLIGGWTWLWSYGSHRAQATIDGWRAREARLGRIYSCGAEKFSGYPFRFEMNCARASAVLRKSTPPLEIKAAKIVTTAQVYAPSTIVSEFTGPLTVAEPGRVPDFIANWRAAKTSASGTPQSPQAVSIVLDAPVFDRMNGGLRENLLRAKHIEINGRIAEGTAANKPVIEVALIANDASAPGLNPAATQPVDADIVAVLRGLNDFGPKPWRQRFREIQAAGGRIDITKARLQQGDTLAVGSGTLTVNAQGRLDGQLRITVAGVESFLKNIGADRLVQASPDVNKLAGTLDKLLPGLGGIARNQASANVALGINLLGQPATLEGRRAVTLPLRFSDGTIMFGPIPIGKTPPLF